MELRQWGRKGVYAMKKGDVRKRKRREEKRKYSQT